MYGAFRFVSNLSSHVVVGLAGLRIPMAVGLTILEVIGMSGRLSLGVIGSLLWMYDVIYIVVEVMSSEFATCSWMGCAEAIIAKWAT